MDFLTTAANNFKYSFQEQLLIFAQKPDATACAEVSWWNKHGRWVNRNTKGIALLVDTDAPYKLRHVFDVSDTNSRVRSRAGINADSVLHAAGCDSVNVSGFGTAWIPAR